MKSPSRPLSTSVHLPGTFRAFRDRNYRLLWPANILAYSSRWMQLTLLGWLVLELTDSALRVALVGVFAMTPMLLLGLVGDLCPVGLQGRVNHHLSTMRTKRPKASATIRPTARKARTRHQLTTQPRSC